MNLASKNLASNQPQPLQPRPLIVGAQGQVGGAIAAAIGPQAIATGRKPTSDGSPFVDLAALAQRPALAAEVLSPLPLSAIYCVGGATDVERCEEDVDWAMQVNCHGPRALAAAARHLPFVYFSTEYIFDGENGPYDEAAPPNPLSVYGRSKALGEQEVLAVHPAPLIVRTTVVYGPDRQAKNFLYTLRRLLSSGQPMRVAVDQVSTPTYNEDLARATVALLASGASGIYHVAGPDLLSRFHFAQLAADILELDASLLSPVATADMKQRAARPLRAGLLIDKLRSTPGIPSMRSTVEAIRAWAERPPSHRNSEAS
jgi:dTDP-4-dehydrorhamnose reductase